MLKLIVEIVYIALLTLLASFIGTLSGFGMSSIMLPVLSFFYPLPQTLLLVGIIHFFGDLWKVLLFKKGINLRLILLFGLPGLLTSYLGARLVFVIPENTMHRLLASILLFFVIIIFVKPGFKLPNKNSVTMFAGLLDGFLAGVTGVGGPIRAAFLSAFNLPKIAYVAASGAIGLMIDTMRIATYVIGGIELDDILILGLFISIPTSFIGAKIGQKVVSKIPQHRFRFMVGSFLLLIALLILVK